MGLGLGLWLGGWLWLWLGLQYWVSLVWCGRVYVCGWSLWLCMLALCCTCLLASFHKKFI